MSSNGLGLCIRFKHVRLESIEVSALKRIMWENVVSCFLPLLLCQSECPLQLGPKRLTFFLPQRQKGVSGNSGHVWECEVHFRKPLALHLLISYMTYNSEMLITHQSTKLAGKCLFHYWGKNGHRVSLFGQLFFVHVKL